MPLNDFAYSIKINGCFVIQNVSSNPQKTIDIFGFPTAFGKQRDLLSIRGVSESDIRSSLFKGVLRNKLLNGEIRVICSDIDLLQFNDDQKQFLKDGGITKGLEIDGTQSNILHYEDVELVGDVDGINKVFTIPTTGKFLYEDLFKIIVYLNGVKQHLSDDFSIFESGGPGTGYDSVLFVDAPEVDIDPIDIITADWYQRSL